MPVICFFDCSLLKEIIFPSKTIKLIGVIDMFNGCKSLTSLMVSYFNVSYVNDFSNMFKDCESLTSLDLSSFITNQQAPIKAMFSNCKNLVYLYFGNGIHFDKTKEYDLFFSGTRNLVVFTNCGTIQGIITLNYDCITWSLEQNWKSYLLRFDVDNNKCINDSCTSLQKYEYLSKCYSTCPTGTYNSANYKCNECHSDCKSCDKSSEKGNTNCNSCSSPYKFFNNGNCISNCKNGYYIDSNDRLNKICKCDEIKCFKCSKESLKKDLCISCNEGYYPIYEEKDIYNPYINCYKLSEEYFLDIINNEKYYMKCYQSCKKCNKAGNEQSHNCIETNQIIIMK